MAETIKRKRGRPRKKPLEPVIDEHAQKRLEMTQENEKVTAQQVEDAAKTLFYTTLTRGTTQSTKSAQGNILNQQYYNPFLQNQRLKMINTLPSHFEKDDIIEALRHPQNSEEQLRGASWELASVQYLYYRILREACDVPLYKYYKTPEFLESSEYSSDEFKDEDRFVEDWLKAFSIVNTFKRIALEVKREGKSTYVLRNSLYTDESGKRQVRYAALEKLPSQYVKLTAIGERGYIASFNMMIFLNPAFSPEQYPEYIQNIWTQLNESGVIDKNRVGIKGKNTLFSQVDVDKLKTFRAMYGTKQMPTMLEIRNKYEYVYWVQLPQELCYTFATDMSHPWVVPDTAGLFLDLKELADYSVLAGLVASTPLTAVLTGEAEIINDPQAGRDQSVISADTLLGLQNLFNSMTSTNTEAFFAPLKNLKLQSLDNVPNSNEIKTSAVQNFVSVAGEGGIIVATDKPSVAQVKGAQLLAASQADYVTRQFERVINFIINDILGLQYKWNIHIWGDIYSLNDQKKYLKEMVLGGMKPLLPKLLSAEDMSVTDGKAVIEYIDSLKIYDKLETIGQAQKEKLAEQVGRPKLDDDEIENDSTAQSRDLGEDTTENKNQ